MTASKYAIYITGFFVIISFLGFDISSVIVGLGAFSIAISFATSTIIQNLISGILVQADKAFKVGDEIKVLNFEGKVVKISIRKTVLETNEGHTIFTPNSVFINNAVIRKNTQNQNRQD